MIKKETQEWLKWRLPAIYLGIFVGFVFFQIFNRKNGTGDFFDIMVYHLSFKLSFIFLVLCVFPFAFLYLHVANIEKGAVMKSMLFIFGMWIGAQIVYVIF